MGHSTPPDLWQRKHNQEHHTFTNIVGKDSDLGYGILRVDETQPWERRHLAQPFLNLLNALVFEYGIAAYDMDLGVLNRSDRAPSPQFREDLRRTLDRALGRRPRSTSSGRRSPARRSCRTLTANLTASVLRNVWSHSVIMCGHFPEGVETFEQESVDRRESRGEWYLRQMLGSANISGPRWLHVLTGNLSHQIEHHLFPDLPSNRYGEIAPQVRFLFERYGLRYHSRRSTDRSPPPGTGSCDSRCPTAGGPTPTWQRTRPHPPPPGEARGRPRLTRSSKTVGCQVRVHLDTLRSG